LTPRIRSFPNFGEFPMFGILIGPPMCCLFTHCHTHTHTYKRTNTAQRTTSQNYSYSYSYSHSHSHSYSHSYSFDRSCVLPSTEIRNGTRSFSVVANWNFVVSPPFVFVCLFVWTTPSCSIPNPYTITRRGQCRSYDCGGRHGQY